MFRKLKKLLYFYYMKAVRDQGTPEYIARGWALGMFVGFAIPFGLQLVVAVPLSFLIKGSKLGAVFGTFVTNHVTVFLIYPVQCWIGNKLICGSLSLDRIRQIMEEVIQNKNYETLFQTGVEVVISFFAGGLLFAAISTPVTYYLVKRFVIKYRQLRETMKKRKQQKKQHEA